MTNAISTAINGVKPSPARSQSKNISLSQQAQRLLDLEAQYTVGGFTPLPGFFERGLGSVLWDVDGKEYLDFICMFSSINQGHCHPKIVAAVIDQVQKAYNINTSTHNSKWPVFAEMMCRRFRYDKISAMVTGAEGADLACKIARRFAHEVRAIPSDQTLVLGVSGNYHGLSGGVWNLQDRSPARTAYGLDSSQHVNFNPTTSKPLRYGHLSDMEDCLKEHHGRVCAVIIESIRNTGK